MLTIEQIQAATKQQVLTPPATPNKQQAPSQVSAQQSSSAPSSTQTQAPSLKKIVQHLEHLQELIELQANTPVPVQTLQAWEFLPTPSNFYCACCQHADEQSLLIWRPAPMQLLLTSHRELETSQPTHPLNVTLREAATKLDSTYLASAVKTGRSVLNLVPYALLGTLTLCHVCYAHITRQAPSGVGRHPVGVAKKAQHDAKVRDLIIYYLNHCNEARVMPTYNSIAQYIHSNGIYTITGKPYTQTTVFQLMQRTGISRGAYCHTEEWGTPIPAELPTNEQQPAPTRLPLPFISEE